ncbi:MAG: DUF6499 domain-containing protein [Novosphingobium sp.]
MARGIDWRSLDFAETFEEFDRADFAQEFLRRNKAYHHDYSQAVRIRSARDQQARLAEIAEHWGLVFRVQP